jgi:hypothetical protein
MAHFAQVVNGIVTQCLVVSNDDCDNLEFPESEPVGQQYLLDCGLGDGWLQTSYNNNFRGVYAVVGFPYDPIEDKFLGPVMPEALGPVVLEAEPVEE